MNKVGWGRLCVASATGVGLWWSSKTSTGTIVGEGHPKTKVQEKQRHWGMPMHRIFQELATKDSKDFVEVKERAVER